MSLLRLTDSISAGLLTGAASLIVIALNPVPASAFVALMAGQSARPLHGTFNTVPVLHSNQPEEVEGEGILISTAPGSSIAAENGQPLRNAEYTFNGDFGLHIHHKYFPPYRASISASERRSELNLAAILINPGSASVRIRFQSGAVRNSFEAPYLANNLMGVKPLGPRPWNTGPGDATAVQMLRNKLDSRLIDEIVVPPRSRVVLFNTPLPALGIANALLRGRSDGPFQVAVVAVKNPTSDQDVVSVLDSGRLAPGRVYLNRIQDINNRRVFSRVGGVAIGDQYQAVIAHDLRSQGALHVPFTSTIRHDFGTREVQVNPLVSRMADSSLDNVGTYGVRFDVEFNLRGDGPYELVMSHPSPTGGRSFTAFRGSIQIQTEEGIRDVHVGLRSGQSLSLATLQLRPNTNNLVRVSMVYPADATPGHLLSVVPSSQLAMVQQRARELELARMAAPAARPTTPPPPPGAPAALTAVPPPPVIDVLPSAPPLLPPLPAFRTPNPPLWQPPPSLPDINQSSLPPRAARVQPLPTGVTIQGGLPASDRPDRYRRALQAQVDYLRGLETP